MKRFQLAFSLITLIVTILGSEAMIFPQDTSEYYFFSQGPGTIWGFVPEGQTPQNVTEKKQPVFFIHRLANETIQGTSCLVFQNVINQAIAKEVERDKFWIALKDGNLVVLQEERPLSLEEKTVLKITYDKPAIYLPSPTVKENEPLESKAEATCITLQNGREIKTIKRKSIKKVTLVSKESVTTPLGTFKDCLKILQEFSWEQPSLPTASNDTFAWSNEAAVWEEFKTYLWFAPEIGPVKLETHMKGQVFPPLYLVECKSK